MYKGFIYILFDEIYNGFGIHNGEWVKESYMRAQPGNSDGIYINISAITSINDIIWNDEEPIAGQFVRLSMNNGHGYILKLTMKQLMDRINEANS